MNVCIVTLYKSYNCGSFYQAYALGEYLKQKGLNVYYMKLRYTFVEELKNFLKPFKKLFFEGINSYKKNKKEIKNFKVEQKKLNLISKKKANKICDIYILGSDTIWNFNSSNLYRMKKIFLGILFTKPKISYAASMANTKINDFINDKDIIDGINQISSISVRDDYSKNELLKITDNKISIVCDPTLLVDRDAYIKNIENRIINDEYIYIYTFDNFSKKQIDNIRKFALSNNLKIVSGVKNYSWVDVCLKNEPKSFINGMYYSKYVITDTFHGTIFSTIFRKNFIVMDRNKNKVNDFLNTIDLKDILVEENDDIDVKLIKSTIYNEKDIINYIKKSKKYIDDIIDDFYNYS